MLSESPALIVSSRVLRLPPGDRPATTIPRKMVLPLFAVTVSMISPDTPLNVAVAASRQASTFRDIESRAASSCRVFGVVSDVCVRASHWRMPFAPEMHIREPTMALVMDDVQV